MADGLPPIRCVSCGKVVAQIVVRYWDDLQAGLSIAEAQRNTGIDPNKWCCHRTIRGAVPPWCAAPVPAASHRDSEHYTYVEPTPHPRELSTA